MPDLTLEPKDHPSLTKPSIVGRQVTVGIKDGNNYKAINDRDLTNTSDKLKKKELKKIKKEVHNDTPQHRKTYKNTMKQWKNHFKK